MALCHRMLTFICIHVVEFEHFYKVQYNYDTQSVEIQASLKIDAIAKSRNYHIHGPSWSLSYGN